MKRIKLLFLFFIPILFQGYAYGQKQINIKVLDSLQHTAIRGVTLNIHQHDSLIFSHTTNEFGELKITLDTNATYRLEVLHIAYWSKQVYISKQTLQGEDLTFRLSKNEKIIAPVKVSANKIKYESDRTTFTVDSKHFTIHQTTIDVFKRIPTINVVNNEIRVMGEKNIAFFYDGKEVDFDFVKLLPAKSIRKIEIKEPNARYKDGKFTIINIIASKGLDGYSLTASQAIGTRNRESSILRTKLSKKKFALNANLQFHAFKNEGTHNSIKTDLQKEELVYRGTRASNFKNYISTSNLVYSIDSSSNINLYTTFTNTPVRNTIQTNSFIPFNLKETISSTNSHVNNVTTSLEYKKQFSNKSVLISNLHYKSNRQKDNIILQQDTIAESRNAIHTNDVIVQADYSTNKDLPINYTFGAKYMRRQNKNDYIQNELAENQNQTENIASLFAEGKWKNRWIDLTAVINMERYKGKQQTIDTRKVDYSNLLHTIMLSKNINSRNNIRLNISKVVYRPSISMLSLFRNNEDINTLKIGNDKLKQEIQESIKITYHTKIAAFYIAFSNSLRFTKNELSPLFTELDNRITRSFININNKSTYTSALNLSYTIGLLSNQFNIAYNHYKIKDANLLLSNKNFNYYSLLYSSELSLKNNWSIAGSLLYDSDINYFQSKTKGYLYADISLNKEFKKLKVSIEYIDMFNRSSNFINTLYLNKTYRQSAWYNSNSLRLQIAYTLGKDFPVKTPRMLNNNDVKDLK